LQADNDFTNERLTALQGKLTSPEIGLIWFFRFVCEISFSWTFIYSTVRTSSGENS
jgi:hypothetical protein